MNLVPLRYLSRVPITNGLGLAGANDNPEWPRYIRTTDIAGPTSLRDDVFASQPPEVAAAAMVAPGDILMTAAGASIGKSVTFRETYPACYAGFLVRVRPLGETEGRFLGYWMQSTHYWDQIRSGAVKSTIENFSAGRYRTLLAPQPEMSHQRAIVDYLDEQAEKVDGLIAEQEGLIDVLRERRIALICRVVTQGLDGSVRLVHSGADWLGEVPSHWSVKRLKFSVTSTQVGVWGAEPTGDDDDVLCVRVADFDRPRLRVSDDIPTVRSVKESDRRPRLLQPGDLLLEKSGGTAINPVGFVGIFDGASGPAVSSNFLTRLRVAEGQHARYWLYAHAASYSTRLTARSVNQTTGIQNLDQAAYFDELFPFPPFEEQCAIVEYLDDQTKKIDALIAEAEGIVAVAKERRSALITAAVTGQIDVRGEAT